MDLIKDNSATLARELDWFERVLELRFQQYFSAGQMEDHNIFELEAPDLENDPSTYAQICRHYNFQVIERLILIMALAPHIKPQALDSFFIRNPTMNRPFTEFGGLTGKHHAGFLPTGETVNFLLSMNDIESRIRLLRVFGPDHAFARFGILRVEAAPPDEPMMGGALQIGSDYLELLTYGHAAKPNYSINFPAQLLSTSLEWEDLILPPEVVEQVEVVRTWVMHSNRILETWQAGRQLKAGYRALLHGPPGTGKTLTASLLGKSAGKDVYLIDSSMVVSKWVGETEKNLARVFDMAENKDWILFFDEADAIFGKRSTGGKSQERYANQQTSYLLQRTENYPGTVILASNLKSNIDDAFMRRFQSVIYYPMPNVSERKSLWEKALKGGAKIDPSIDLKQIAKDYEITGGSIVNVLKYCAIMAERRGLGMVTLEDIEEGIHRELRKDGKMV